MGGPGSGMWYRWKQKKTTLDDVYCLDVRWLHRHGYVRPALRVYIRGAGGEFQEMPLEPESLVLVAPSRTATGAGEDGRHVVELDWTPCHYGGARPWFRCPGCHRRVAVLCLAGPWFVCRHCAQLPYGSQQEAAEVRLLRKVSKLRERLGASQHLLEPIWTKPKGMHWRTFARLVQEEEAAQRAQLGAMHAALDRLEAAVNRCQSRA